MICLRVKRKLSRQKLVRKTWRLGKEPRKETENYGRNVASRRNLSWEGVLDFIKCLFASIEVMHFSLFILLMRFITFDCFFFFSFYVLEVL